MKYVVILIVLFFTNLNSIYTNQGCCSWHGGIDYCGSNGYYICNDGTQSPSCRCSGGIELTDGNSDCSTYQNTINDLNSELAEKNKQIKELKDDKESTDDWLTFLIFSMICYFIYRAIKSTK